MRSLISIFLIPFFICTMQTFLFSQTNPVIWKRTIKTVSDQKEKFPSKKLPNKFLTFELKNQLKLKEELSKSPLRFSQASLDHKNYISLPMPNGQLEKFKVFKSPIMQAQLAVEFPNIRTYTAVGIDDPMAVAKIDISPNGFHAMIISPGKSSVFINPIDLEGEEYISFDKKDFPLDQGIVCSIENVSSFLEPNIGSSQIPLGDCDFREYRLALACTGEYAQYHDDGDNSNGDITDDAMAAMVTSMNRVNGIYERDMGLTMILIANNSLLIYTNANTDPYTNNNGVAMLSENQSNVNSVIGSSNYDIGHVFSTGGGGVASLQSPCSNNLKARGVTGRGAPVGDPFDVDYVAHEMGHQFGGNHTFNNSCGGNRNTSTAYEPGSGSTIMAYAGICAPNVQSNSDDHFHGISLEEMSNFVTNGGNCAAIISTANDPPTANAGSDYSIPVSTPFELTGSATDPNGDSVSYCWEQMDNEIATMPPVSTSTDGPNFRSFSPTTNPVRVFPRLSLILGGGSDDFEILPSVTRTMNFRLSVRDNNNGYGCSAYDEMVITTNASAGPFLINYPNLEEDWDVGDNKTITWDVANTTASPVSCSNVDILLSTDGGLNFTTTLASNIPNDGSHNITVPNVASSLCRIKIKCSDNIFFDINDANITIGVTISCATFTSSDVPVAISSTGTPTVTSDLNISIGETIADINVKDLIGDHTYVGDLIFTLKHPSGVEVTLINRKCTDDDDFDIDVDLNGSTLTCPFNNNQTVTPEGNIVDFNNLSTDGLWILEVQDAANQDGGNLNGWGLEICYEVPIAPLPIELVDFKVRPRKNDILLTWETANEVDNVGFEVQRSRLAEDGFEKIGWIDGNGDIEAASYNFIDESVETGIQYYYRLKQIDFDEDFTFSPIQSAILQIGKLEVKIAPNPVRRSMVIDLAWEGKYKGEIQIIDLFGRMLFSRKYTLENRQNIELDLSHFPSGIYFLKVENEGFAEFVERFFKQ